ncbi:hypothetical protein [Pseudoxanthomonas sp. CF125]|uniref:hypothetical protein n=1 Tax=Pseudoxanthomonas sp. CF125 TaxID=1855303 RepID=UPI00115F7D76|nr:hypothetical protein [Pseudoxanthomonas sp. CF125]
MRFVIALAMLLCFTTIGFSQENAQPPNGVYAADQKKEFTMALAAAYEAANKGRLSTRNKTVVVANHGKYVVVSFLANGSVRGGQAHIVYDPQLKQVVYVLGED